MTMRIAPRLERVGLARVAESLRHLRWWWAAVRPTLRHRHALELTSLWMREPVGRQSYRVLSEEQLRRSRRADTVFVFGSGASLRDISVGEWERIAGFDTIGFSHFHRQRWVRVDYHLIYEVASATETAASIRDNPLYAETIFGVGKGWLAEASNELVGKRMLPRGAKVFRWRRIARGRMAPPSDRLSRGLVHGVGSALDAVNFALLLGWTHVVIAGVDLYGDGYFWMPTEAENGQSGRWAQADVVVEAMRSWQEAAARKGVRLSVYDARSVLTEALPVFDW